MLRARLAVVVLAAILGLTGGCASLCNRPLFSRFRDCPECMDLGMTSMGEGPILDGCAVPMPPPNGFAPAPLMPQATIPQLSTPPRLVPQPQQSQPMPYTP
jgi:hypothetical protein